MSSLYSAVQKAICGSVRQTAPDRFEAEFIFRDDFIGFSGHFPEKPVLPGIAQIMAAQVTVDANPSLSLAHIKRCKFLRPVLPEERLLVSAECRKQEDGSYLVTAQLRVNKEPCANMAFLLLPVRCEETK